MMKKKTKGERLNWPLLEDYKPSNLTPEMLKGKKLTEQELRERGRLDKDHIFLIP